MGNTSRKTSTGGKRSGKKKANSAMNGEIAAIIVIAVAFLLFLGNLHLLGAFGDFTRTVLFGMFGICGWAFPFLLCVIWLMIKIRDRIPMFARRMTGLIGLYVFTCAFMEALMIGYQKEASVIDSFTGSAADGLGGGLAGGAIVKLIGTGLGNVGVFVIVVIVMILFAIVLTQKSLLNTIFYVAEKAKAQKQDEDDYLEPEERVSSRRRFSMPVVSENDGGRAEKDMRSGAYDRAAAADPTQGEDFDEPPVAAEAPKRPARTRRAPQPESTSRASNFDVPYQSGNGEYQPPPLTLLRKGSSGNGRVQVSNVKETAYRLQQTLHNFGVETKVINATCGPTVTRYELQPEQGVKVSRIVNLADDIKLNLAASDIRIEAPIPGKAAVGIEVPNTTNSTVSLRDLLESKEFQGSTSKLSFAVGKDLAGKPVIADIAKMPHLLIAGATGSGKSVCINTLIMSLIYKASPDEVKLLMIDPKVVELSVYNGIPHLVAPVVTEAKKAAGALAWAVAEMTRRYNMFAELGVRDLAGYNNKIAHQKFFSEGGEEAQKPMPQIVVIVDELADLMMVSPKEVEDSICRLAQLARAAGLHVIIATQRPSVNVITGLIKANMPSRIALAVTSGIDSRVIIDMNGAEKLLGKGDMLFYPAGYPKPARVQGGYVSDDEIQKVVDHLIAHQGETDYDPRIDQAMEESSAGMLSDDAAGASDDRDVYFADAGKLIIEKDKASIGMLQRAFKIGFNRAARIMDQLCEAGVVGPEEGTKPRHILMNMEQFLNYLKEN